MRPVPLAQWISAKEVAGAFGLAEDSAYRWRDDGTIPRDYVKRCGTRRFRFHPDVIPALERIFDEMDA